MTTPAVSDDEKRTALARVLESKTFSRSDQLRAFLRYVCEAELEGRAQQLNEYALGVSVLGRKEGYSPAEDSGVRSRAYELRNKLASYYRDEAPDDPIQIDIEKGAYIPRFQRRGKTPEPEPADDARTVPVALTAAQAAASAGVRRRRVVMAVVAALLIVAVVSVRSIRPPPTATGLAARASTPEMQALWTPFLDTNTPLLMSFEIRLFLFAPEAGLVVRDFRTNQKDEVAQSKPLNDFKQRMGSEQLIDTYDYADVGAVQAAFILGRILNREVSLKYSSTLGWEDIWNSNVIFVRRDS